MIEIPQLGNRICIIGPSNSGKSTLADKLAEKLSTKTVHLDQLAHIPNSNWQRRPDSELIAAHDLAITKDSWVIDGNYSVCMPQRLDRATSVIWIDPPPAGFLYRYMKRCLTGDPQRPGRLHGAQKEFSLALIQYTLFTYPKKRGKYAKLLEERKIPVLHFHSMRELNRHYRYWQLSL